MSHAPERSEKDCLNCGTVVHGRFCHFCGQENVVTRESFKNLVIHFFYDITHFDSKFFDSLKFLLTRPGFLSKEYMRGRRARYLNPIRMYVFTSAFFFLIFFALKGSKDLINYEDDAPFTLAERDSAIIADRDILAKDSGDVDAKRRIELMSDTSRTLRPSDLLAYSGDFTIIGTMNGKYRDKRHYDSIQSTLPKSERDGWLASLWNKRAIAANEKYRYNPTQGIEKLGDKVLHMLPYLLFVSLPFFAMILKLLYIRKKQWYYADHGIFTVHHYILSFILLLFMFIWNGLETFTNWKIWNFFTAITILCLPVFLFLAMKRFYGQGTGKTFVKFLLLNILGLIMLLLLLVVFFLLSVFQL